MKNFTGNDFGIPEPRREAIADGLKKLLADTYTLYLKTQNFHWNVTGITFAQLHLLFETQYTELAQAIDVVAERIRALGFFAHASFREFQSLTSIKESTEIPNAREMIHQLVNDQEAVIKTARSVFGIAKVADDDVTLDLLISRMNVHEKTAWMLRSLLDE